MKILLVNPPDHNRMLIPGYSTGPISIHDYSPPLGLMYIKSYLLHHTDYTVRLFNFQQHAMPTIDDFLSFLEDYSPDIIGITVMTPFWYDVCQLTKAIRATMPRAFIVGGGAHMWLYPEDTIKTGQFDAIVQGEGEITFAKLIQRVEKGKKLNDLPGTVFRDNDMVVINPPCKIEKNPDHFPFPDRSDFDWRHFRYVTTIEHPPVLMISSRGCPYQCAFCNNKDRLYRPRQPNKVVDEIVTCKEMGYRSIEFFDDNFTTSYKHVEALCAEMINRNVNMPWTCRTRVDNVDRDILKLMAEAGCKRVHFGVESVHQHYLDFVNKGIKVEDSRNAFALCKEAGIETLAYFLIGFPGETLAEAKKTITFAFDIDPDYIMLNALVPIPGTKIYDEAVRLKAIDGNYMREYVGNPSPNFKIKLFASKISERDILKLLRKTYLAFYFRPRLIWRNLKRLTSVDEFITKASIAVRLLFYSK